MAMVQPKSQKLRLLLTHLLLLVFIAAILFPLLMAEGMQRVDASHGGVVLGVLPIATALVAVMITHERPRPSAMPSPGGSPLICRAGK